MFFLPQNSSGAITRIGLLERLWVYYKDRACGTALGLLKGYGLCNDNYGIMVFFTNKNRRP